MVQVNLNANEASQCNNDENGLLWCSVLGEPAMVVVDNTTLKN